MDCGLISKNSRDSLAKARALTGIFDRRLSDLDQTVRSPIGGAGRGGSDGPILIWDRSNLDRPFTIGRPGPIGTLGGGAVTMATPFRGGAARGSSDFTVNGASGVKSSGAWVCRNQCDTRDPPGALSGPSGARGCARGGRGGSARRRSPACGVPAAGTAYGLQHLAQKGQERVLVLIEGSDWSEKQRRGVDVDGGRWR
jgi:hypothetical protein